MPTKVKATQLIETQLKETIDLLRKARSLTAEARDKIVANPADPSIPDLLGRNIVAHKDAKSAAQRLGETADTTEGLGDIKNTLKLAAAEAQRAHDASEELKATPGAQQAHSALAADDAGVQRLTDADAAFRIAPEVKETRTGWWANAMKLVSGYTATEIVGFLVAFGIVAVAATCLVALLLSLLRNDSTLLIRLSKVESARGLITCLLGVSTVVIALMLTVGALLSNGSA